MLEVDEMDEDENVEGTVPYLIDSLDDEGAYDGISTKNDLYTTDDKTNMDRDL